ncbi:MAG: hypothetical protein WB660_09815 [Candidatus Sulfotelmatobacter sp.]
MKGQSKAPVTAATDVSDKDLLMQPTSANWTSYNGDYTGRRYSSLHEINVANIAKLRAAWVFHPGNSKNLEATPVVINGVMYVTSANDVFALDARTGRIVWRYQRLVSSGLLDDFCIPRIRFSSSTPSKTVLESAHIYTSRRRNEQVSWLLEIPHNGCIASVYRSFGD